MEKKFERVNELLNQEDFVAKLGEMESDEDVVELFSANGAEITLEDVEKMCEEAIQTAEKEMNLELQESELDDVAGGVLLTTVGCFALSAASLLFYGGYAKYRYGRRKK